MADYRDDDQTVGYCPKCGSRLSTLNIDAIGYCGLHGWVPAEWERPPVPAGKYGDWRDDPGNYGE